MSKSFDESMEQLREALRKTEKLEQVDKRKKKLSDNEYAMTGCLIWLASSIISFLTGLLVGGLF